MEVPLDGPNRAAQCLGQCLHLGPAQPCLVVGIVGEGAVGRDRLSGDSGVGEVLDLGDTGKFGLLWHRCLLFVVRRCALMIEFTKAGGPREKDSAPPLFLCSFSDAYSTCTGILALAPEALFYSRSSTYNSTLPHIWYTGGGTSRGRPPPIQPAPLLADSPGPNGPDSYDRTPPPTLRSIPYQAIA